MAIISKSKGEPSSRMSHSTKRSRHRSLSHDLDRVGHSSSSYKKKISEDEIAEYLAKKARTMAKKVVKKLKTFVWRKKIERDVSQGVPLEAFSVRAEKKRQKERKAEIEKVKKRREERAVEKAHHEEEMALLARERAQAEFQDWEKKEEEFHFDQSKVRSEMKLMHGDETEEEEEEEEAEEYPRKPKYFNRVHKAYEWNKYNQTHYDQANPPPKIVQGYKFNIFYPNLVDKTKAPVYTIDKDGDSSETCIIRFHAGPPYEDIAFRIVNNEWEYSRKKGFKCTFERGILHLYFNFNHHRYCR